METYTIPFFIPGDDCTFSVDIEKTRVVYHLKRLIKQEAPALNNLPANSLKLYQVLIDRPPNKEQRIKVLNNLYLNKGGMELDENEKLSRHFGESPPEGMQYYIIVQIPKLLSRSDVLPWISEDILTTRDVTVAALYDRMEFHRLVMVCGTPASGKSILAALLAKHIQRVTSQAPVFINGWANRNTPWRVRLERAGLSLGAKRTQYLIVDEGQTSYWDQDFYMSFIKPLDHFLHYRVVIFTGYGGARNEVELEGDHIYKTTPIVIPPSQHIALQPSADSDLGPVGLLLSRHEYDEMYKKFYPPIQLEDTLYHEIYQITAGHAGAVHDLFYLISCHSSYREAWQSQKIYSFADFELNITEWAMTEALWNTKNFSRGLPRREDLQDPQVARAFRKLLATKHVQDDHTDNEDQRCFKSLYKKGWVDLVKCHGDGLCYIFATGLHERVVDCHLGVKIEQPNIKETSIFDFTIAVLHHFSFRQLAAPRQVGNSVQNPPEAQYQDEFYRCAHLHSEGSLVMFPAFGSAKGRVDFFVNSKKWAIELLRNSDRIEEHLARFAPEGKYRRILDAADYIILNFQTTVPETPQDDPKLYHIVFENEENERLHTLHIFNHNCIELTSIELLND